MEMVIEFTKHIAKVEKVVMKRRGPRTEPWGTPVVT